MFISVIATRDEAFHRSKWFFVCKSCPFAYNSYKNDGFVCRNGHFAYGRRRRKDKVRKKAAEAAFYVPRAGIEPARL